MYSDMLLLPHTVFRILPCREVFDFRLSDWVDCAWSFEFFHHMSPLSLFLSLLVSAAAVWGSAIMDFQHRAGGKTGSGGVASSSESNRDRRERLRQLALETIDINKDPYFMKNHLGSYECKLCLTLHNNEVCVTLMHFMNMNAFFSPLNVNCVCDFCLLGKLSRSHTRQKAPV